MSQTVNKQAEKERTERFTVRMTEEEKRRLRVRAARENQSMSEYIRDVVLGNRRTQHGEGYDQHQRRKLDAAGA